MRDKSKVIFIIVAVLFLFNFLILGISGVFDHISLFEFADECDQIEDNGPEYIYLSKSSHQTIGNGEYDYWYLNLSVTTELRITYHNKSLNPFDILILTESNFEKYENDESFTGYNIDVGSQDSLWDSISLDRGVYYIIIDNTSKGNVIPIDNENSTIELETTIYYEEN